jgi:predicted 3-demethylubiquinone-9 3-methyltransferase (glyoxalase superfamily)
MPQVKRRAPARKAARKPAKQRQKITTFLWFDNNAEEAMKFYVSVFKNSRIVRIDRFADAGMGPVVVGTFQLAGQTFQALNGGPAFKFTPAISLYVHCADQKEVDYYWDKLLSGGGKPSQCGWLEDRFGLSWQIIPRQLDELMRDRDPKKSRRVMEAMLKMVKIDVATLERAYRGE